MKRRVECPSLSTVLARQKYPVERRASSPVDYLSLRFEARFTIRYTIDSESP
jgi:hypothetical protein